MDWQPMQWRGSDNGITWSKWCLLFDTSELLPAFTFYQARILIDGEWKPSKIEADAH
jgi:hypothetical protein